MGELQSILSQLPLGDRAKVIEYIEDIKEFAYKSAVAAIMVRNFSHGIGPNIQSEPGKEVG